VRHDMSVDDDDVRRTPKDSRRGIETCTGADANIRMEVW
jgi:hypothetical protein